VAWLGPAAFLPSTSSAAGAWQRHLTVSLLSFLSFFESNSKKRKTLSIYSQKLKVKRALGLGQGVLALSEKSPTMHAQSLNSRPVLAKVLSSHDTSSNRKRDRN
jgi:hypothetical protein